MIIMFVTSQFPGLNTTVRTMAPKLRRRIEYAAAMNTLMNLLHVIHIPPIDKLVQYREAYH